MVTAERLETISKKDIGERRWHELAAYLLAIVLCLLFLVELLGLRKADLTTPITYIGDGLFYAMTTKAVVTNGWWMTNDSLGAPHGAKLQDYPQNDCFTYSLIWIIGLFTSNWATVYNLFYLLTFPLTTISSFYVLRKFNLSRAPAIMASLLYSFICPHFAPGQYHLVYSVIFPLPLMIMVILWVCSEQLSLTRTEDGRTRLNLRNRKLIAALLICVLIASTGGPYYSFFAICLLGSVALFLALRHKSIVKPLTPVFLIIVISGAFVTNQTPTLLNRLKYGKTDVARRSPAEADHYGLKIGQLLLPLSVHRINAFARFKERYDKSPISEGESINTSPGFIGSFGFLFLIGWLLYRRGRNDEADRPRELFNHMSMLNATAVLIATIGGFGSLFAHLVWPQIRAYSRFGLYISFLAFFTSALLLDLLFRKFLQTRSRKIVFYILISLLTIVGLFDETRKYNYPYIKDEFMNDRDFVREIESVMPERAMIYQLPFDLFPERTYEHFRGYLHSNKLRWSFGAMRGRYGSNWHEMISRLPTEEMIKTVAIAGFSGVWVDRQMYPDNGAKIESELSSLLQSSPLTSRNQRLLFFNLTEYRKTVSGDPGKIIPLIPQWRGGVYDLEVYPEANWRWCSTNGELILENHLPRERNAVIEMGVSSLNPGQLRIESMNFSETIPISTVSAPFQKKFTIPPGAFYSIRFTSTARAIIPPPDTRLLSFRLINFSFKEE